MSAGFTTKVSHPYHNIGLCWVISQVQRSNQFTNYDENDYSSRVALFELIKSKSIEYMLSTFSDKLNSDLIQMLDNQNTSYEIDEFLPNIFNEYNSSATNIIQNCDVCNIDIRNSSNLLSSIRRTITEQSNSESLETLIQLSVLDHSAEYWLCQADNSIAARGGGPRFNAGHALADANGAYSGAVFGSAFGPIGSIFGAINGAIIHSGTAYFLTCW